MRCPPAPLLRAQERADDRGDDLAVGRAAQPRDRLLDRHAHRRHARETLLGDHGLRDLADRLLGGLLRQVLLDHGDLGPFLLRGLRAPGLLVLLGGVGAGLHVAAQHGERVVARHHVLALVDRRLLQVAGDHPQRARAELVPGLQRDHRGGLDLREGVVTGGGLGHGEAPRDGGGDPKTGNEARADPA